jgi:Uma2 family endonuclease
MLSSKPRVFIASRYERAAQDYLRSLPPEHFMEAVPQSRQREITLESLALVREKRPDFQLFNELLVLYPNPDDDYARPFGVVPDNMVVLHTEPIQALGSFDIPLQPVGPFWVLEYVSSSNKRKDYEDSYLKYEQHLKVPYYLLFYPDNQELTLFRHNGEKYVTVLPNERGRLAIPEVEIEAALLEGWVRYWYQGELLPLPGDLLRSLEKTSKQLEESQQARILAEQEIERLKAELAALKGKTTSE